MSRKLLKINNYDGQKLNLLLKLKKSSIKAPSHAVFIDEPTIIMTLVWAMETFFFFFNLIATLLANRH